MASVGTVSPYSLENEIFRVFLTYATLVSLKMMSVSFLTAYVRVKNSAFGNKEDYPSGYPEEKIKQKMEQGCEFLDLVKRCHLNDLENIPVFLIVGLLYVATNPSVFTAAMHFRIFTGFRFLHYFVYVNGIPQPARGLCFFFGAVTTISMAVQILMTVFQL